MGIKLNPSDDAPWGRVPTTGAAGSTPTAATDAATQVVQAANEAQRQALAAKAIPPPPLQSPIDADGQVTAPWSFWFVQMWRRSGGNVSPSSSDLALLSLYGDDSIQTGRIFDSIEAVELLGITDEPRRIRTMDLPLSSQVAEALALFGDASPRQFQLTGDVTKPYNSTTTTLVNIPSGVTMAGFLLATAIAAPSTPASGKASIYVDSTSKNLAVKNDAGTVNHGVQTKAATSHQFLTAIADDGTVSAAQPANTDITGLGTMSTQNANAVSITGGAIDGTTVGSTTKAAGAFTTVTTSSTLKVATTAQFGSTSIALANFGAGSYGTASSQTQNAQASGEANLAAYVNDGTNNWHVKLFVDQPNAVWGLKSGGTTGNMTFKIYNSIGAAEIASATNAGAWTFISTVQVAGLISTANNTEQQTANGAQWILGQASENLTLSTSGTTTDTSANLLPANAIIEAVVARVTTTITTATDWKLGDSTTAGRFSAASSSMTSGSTTVGTVQADQTGAAGPRQASAAKVRVTTTGTPGAGAIRITVFYRQFVAPTS